MKVGTNVDLATRNTDPFRLFRNVAPFRSYNGLKFRHSFVFLPADVASLESKLEYTRVQKVLEYKMNSSTK